MQHTAETLHQTIQSSEVSAPHAIQFVISFLFAELQKLPIFGDTQKETQLRALNIDHAVISQAKEANGGHITFLPSEPDIYFNYRAATLARLIVLFTALQPQSGEVFFCDVVDDQARPVKRADLSYTTARDLAAQIASVAPENITASVQICDLQVNGSITLPAEQSHYRIKVTYK